MVGFEHAETTGKYLVSMDFPIIKLQSLPPADFPLDEVAAALGIPRAGILDALLALPDVLVHVDANNFASLTPDLPRLARMPARYVYHGGRRDAEGHQSHLDIAAFSHEQRFRGDDTGGAGRPRQDDERRLPQPRLRAARGCGRGPGHRQRALRAGALLECKAGRKPPTHRLPVDARARRAHVDRAAGRAPGSRAAEGRGRHCSVWVACVVSVTGNLGQTIDVVIAHVITPHTEAPAPSPIVGPRQGKWQHE